MSRENIYGNDDCDFAEGIAADALENTGGKEDFWGATFDQSARAKGNAPEFENPEAKAVKFEGTEKATKSKGN